MSILLLKFWLGARSDGLPSYADPSFLQCVGIIATALCLLPCATATSILQRAARHVYCYVGTRSRSKVGIRLRVVAMLVVAMCYMHCANCQYRCTTDSDCSYSGCTSLTSSYSPSSSCSCNPYQCNPYQCNPYQCNPYQCNARSCNCRDCNCFLGICFSTCCDTCYDTCYSTCYRDTCYSTCYDYCSCSFTCSNTATCSSGLCIASGYSVSSGSTCCGASCSSSQSYCPSPPLCPAGTWSVDGYNGPGEGRQCQSCLPGTYAPSQQSTSCMTCEAGMYSRNSGNALVQHAHISPFSAVLDFVLPELYTGAVHLYK